MNIIRKRHKTKFRYFEGNHEITDKGLLERISSLAIPPAWKDVEIAASPKSKVQASGIDRAGRKQYIYNAKFRERQEAKKFERILSFAERLPKLRRQITKDLAKHNLSKDKVLACVVELMDEAYFRVGNDTYAKNNQSYGLTTLRSKHADIKTHKVTFDFTGKSGKQHHKTIKNRQIARILKQLDELPGYELFEYLDENGGVHRINSKDVNDYIKQNMGSEFTAKDFRTWGGTVLACMELISCQTATNDKMRKKKLTLCVKKVASRLGNTPAVARASYIDSRLIRTYQTSNDIKSMADELKDVKPKKYLKKEEANTLEILKKISS